MWASSVKLIWNKANNFILGNLELPKFQDILSDYTLVILKRKNIKRKGIVLMEIKKSRKLWFPVHWNSIRPLVWKEISVQDPWKVQVLLEIHCYTATVHQTAELADGLINHISPTGKQQFQITQWSVVTANDFLFHTLMEESLSLMKKWPPKLG